MTKSVGFSATLALIAGLSVLLIPATGVLADDPPPGFVSLFNGRDLTGWKVPEGDNGHWKVVDGVIDYDAESEAPGDKSLWSEGEYGDFVLRVDWRIKDTPWVNPHAKIDIAVPDSDSGIYLRGNPKSQVNIWCWPVGSGEVYGYRTDESMPPDVRAGVVPTTIADHNIGEWNSYEITMKGDRLTVVLNGKKVIDQARLPGVAARGPIGLQHHGSKEGGVWVAPPALVQFRNISIKTLD
jgi:hypothetical protein